MANKEKEAKLALEKYNADLSIENQTLKNELKNCLMALSIEKQQNARLLQKWSAEIQ